MSGSLLERLADTARLREFPSDEATLGRLVAYLEAVLDANRLVNLTAARDLDQAVDVLALSALSVTRAVERSTVPRLVADLGTGNGLPGVAAALAWPRARVLLVERRQRKAQAVAGCVRRAGIENASVVACDGRDLLRLRPRVAGAADLVTVRAVGSLEEAAALTAPWLAPGGRLAQWKGRRLQGAEEEAGAAAARRAGLDVLPPLVFDDEGGPARLVLYERPRPA